MTLFWLVFFLSTSVIAPKTFTCFSCFLCGAGGWLDWVLKERELIVAVAERKQEKPLKVGLC